MKDEDTDNDKKHTTKEQRLEAARKARCPNNAGSKHHHTTTDDDVSSEFMNSDCDFQACSDSDDDVRTPIFYAITSGHLHPALKKIYQGNYTVLFSKASRSIVVGEFQFLADIRSFYAPRKVLYKLIRVLFPFIHISYNVFLQRTVTIVKPRNRTDLCSICHQYELLQSQWRKSTPTDSTTPKMQEEIQKFEAHKLRYLTQRHQFVSQRTSLVPREVLLVIDFKENIKYPIMKEQEGRDFYRQKQITCLSCVCYKRLPTRDMDETIFTFFSVYKA